MSTIDPENTVANVKDDLDNYGDHLPVIIESETTGRHYQVGEIRTMGTPDGPVVVIVIGDTITEV